jgi:hypothetical protein
VRPARAFGRWMREHEEELRVFVIWGSVLRGCERTRLYAPVDVDSWQAIKDVADDESKSDAELEAVILARYGPDGPGFEALRSEISEAPLLQDRLKDVGEVLEAFESGRNYLTICGTLPLVEFVLSNAKGKWDQPNELPISRRLLEESGLSEQDEAHLLLYGAAVEMLRRQINEVWKPAPHQVGKEVVDLNRHLALHGTALDWSTPENATRVVLLLAAACQVAEPLLGPRPAKPGVGSG